MGLRVLVDTNVILDYICMREPYTETAKKIIEACQRRELVGCIAAHSVTNIFYILRKNFSVEERRLLLQDICRLFEVEGIDEYKLKSALKNENFEDFEDCLQMECAKGCHADYIVTRNIKDFGKSDIPCILPECLCDIIKI